MGMTGLHDACCWLAFQLIFCHSIFSNSSPVTRQPRSHYLVLGFPVWHFFMPGVVLVLPNPQTRPRPRKKVVLQLPGNNHQSKCQELSFQFATASFRTEFGLKCPKTGLCISSVLPFGLLTWPPIDLEFNRFSLADRFGDVKHWFSAGEAMQ
jgi:hypothetical protein